jgi:hypothetical protein
MARTTGGIRIEPQGIREGHGDTAQHNLSARKGTFYQIGTAVDQSETPFSPNRKTGTASGTSEH